MTRLHPHWALLSGVGTAMCPRGTWWPSAFFQLNDTGTSLNNQVSENICVSRKLRVSCFLSNHLLRTGKTALMLLWLALRFMSNSSQSDNNLRWTSPRWFSTSRVLFEPTDWLKGFCIKFPQRWTSQHASSLIRNWMNSCARRQCSKFSKQFSLIVRFVCNY